MCRETVTMNATILQVCDCELLVCDTCNTQEVLVRTSQANCFSVGERVCIEYNGVMTRSIPPQITATCIYPMGC